MFLHFGSVSLTAEPARSATLAAAGRARELGILLSYDPNYRQALWSSQEEAVAWMKKPLSLVDVLKISDEELPLVTGMAGLEEGTKALQDLGITLVLVTLGGDGAYYRLGEHTGHVPRPRGPETPSWVRYSAACVSAERNLWRA